MTKSEQRMLERAFAEWGWQWSDLSGFEKAIAQTAFVAGYAAGLANEDDGVFEIFVNRKKGSENDV